MARDDEGQMMLLAAVVLVIAFLALTTLVARTSNLRQETLRPAPAILGEAEAVQRAAWLAVNTTATPAEFDASMLQLKRLEASRGFVLEGDCALPGGASLRITVHHGRSAVSFDLVFGGATCGTDF